jgi:hypothetical protein
MKTKIISDTEVAFVNDKDEVLYVIKASSSGLVVENRKGGFTIRNYHNVLGLYKEERFNGTITLSNRCSPQGPM